MKRSLIIFALIINHTLALSLKLSLKLRQWNEFKSLHSLSYMNGPEDINRSKIFFNNLNEINAHNIKAKKGLESYTMDINKFSHLNFDEVLGSYAGLLHKKILKLNSSSRIVKTTLSKVKRPMSFDLRNTGFVGAIKDQGRCGACWAFAAVATLEGQYFRKYGQSINLSEQQLIDCSTSFGNMGCNGGLELNAFDYVIFNHGIATSGTYPYVGRNQNCLFSGSVGIEINQSSYVTDNSYGSYLGNEYWLESMVGTIGPIAVEIYASPNFIKYKSGIFYDSLCNGKSIDTVNHAVTAVGFGTDSAHGAYWILRNSWGTNWGERGYMRMAKNVGNHCFVSSFSSYPVL